MKASYLDTNMLYMLNLNMCTGPCPCDAGAYNSGYSTVSESDLGYHGRTNSGTPEKLPITVGGGGITTWT